MPWINNEFRYSARLLQRIAYSYLHIYDRIVLGDYIGSERFINKKLDLVEYKVDFDRALNAIGKGQWKGLIGVKLSDYKGLGRLQKLVIADILGIEDWELVNFYDISRLRGYAYSAMARFLNGVKRYL